MRRAEAAICVLGALAAVAAASSCASSDAKGDGVVGASATALTTRAPTSFPPRPLDPQVIPSPTPGPFATRPDVACNPTNCYAAWTVEDNYTAGMIAGTRLALDGTVADPTATFLSSQPTPAGDSEDYSAVATNGSDFLVVWTRNGSTTEPRGIRVGGADGAPRDPLDGFALQAGNSADPAAASDGRNYAVALTRFDSVAQASSVVVARIDAASGAVLDNPGIAVSTQPSGGSGIYLAMAFDGTRYVTAWVYATASAYSLNAARVTPAGARVDGPPENGGVSLVPSTPEILRAPTLSIAGSVLLACWERGSITECARFATADLSRIDAVPFTVATTGAVPRVASTASTFAVTTSPSGSGGGARTLARFRAPDGAALGSTTLPPSGILPWLPVATAGADFLVLLADSIGVYSTSRVQASDGAILGTGEPLCRGPNAQRDPAVGSDGTNFIAAWSDYRADARTVPYAVYARRLDGASGNPIDARATLVMSSASPLRPTAIAFGGGVYAVATGLFVDPQLGRPNGATVRLVRASDGVPIGSTYSTTVASLSAGPIACDATNCVLVSGDPGSSTVSATRIRISDGTVLGTTAIYKDAGLPSVTSDGSVFFIVSEGSGRIHAKRLRSSDGVMLDGDVNADGIAISDGGGALPGVAFDGDDYLVAWKTGSSVRAARVSGAGVLLDGPPSVRGFQIATASGGSTKVTYDGAAFVVAWQSYGVRLSRSGTLLDPPATSPGFPFAQSVGSALFSDFAAASATHRFLAVYEDIVQTSAFHGYRVFGHLFQDDLGSTCSGVTPCVTGVCVDGVCCDTACGGGAGDDCQACSRALGASVDGTCGPVVANRACRAATMACQAVAVCDGTSLACPANGTAPDGTSCPGGSCLAGTCSPTDAGALDGAADADAHDASGPHDAATPSDAAPADGASGTDGANGTDAAGAEDAATPAEGGADAGKPGPSADGGDGGDGTSPGDDGGCGCRAGRTTTGDAGVLFATALALSMRRRRRERRAGLTPTRRGSCR